MKMCKSIDANISHKPCYLMNLPPARGSNSPHSTYKACVFIRVLSAKYNLSYGVKPITNVAVTQRTENCSIGSIVPRLMACVSRNDHVRSVPDH